MKKIIVPVIVFLSSIGLAQLPNGRNHPELRWRFFDTPHFRVIYHQGLDSLACVAADIAESMFGPVTRDLNIEIRRKIPLILTDVDDASNGIANPLDHTLFIWTQSEKLRTTGTLRWLEAVIGHEFTHTANFWGCRNFLGKPWELVTLGLTPTWFIEGVAQYEAERWDDHRDMLLRVTSLDRSLLPLRKLDGFVGADPLESRLVYEQGHGLVRYISSRFGKEKPGELILRHRRFPISFAGTLRKTLGASMKDLFRDWKEYSDSIYRDGSKSKEKPDAIGQGIDIPLDIVTGVRWSPDGKTLAVVGIERWDEGIQRLYIGNDDGTEFRMLGGAHLGSYFSWAPDGGHIAIHRKRRGRHGSLVDDLSIIEVPSGDERRITSNARATDPAWSPDGTTLCYVKRTSGGSAIWRHRLVDGQEECVFESEAGIEVATPSWSPDGSSIAFSIIDARGFRDIARVGADGSDFTRLTWDAVDDRTPAWSPDGGWIAYCSYEDGTPNLYRSRPDGSERTRMTDVSGGVFNPSWHPDGGGITAIVFERRDRVVSYTIPARRITAKPSEQPKPDWSRFEPFKKPASGMLERERRPASSKPYRSLVQIKPLILLPYLGQDDGGIQLGFVHYAADPLMKQSVLGTLTGRKRIDWLLTYSNANLEPLLDIRFWGRTYNRGIHLIEDGPRLWERRTGLSLNVSFPMNFGRTLLANHVVTFTGELERVRNLVPDDFLKFKPHFRPFTGWINSLECTYAWVWERPDVGFGVHPASGFTFLASLLWSGSRIGSDVDRTRLASIVQYRQELPWSRHVLVTRIGSFYQWGEQPIQDRFSIGSPHTLRGLSRAREGDRFAYGSTEYRIPLIRDLGFRIPVVYFERFAGSLWVDWGKAWGRDLMTYETDDRRGFNQVEWMATAGAEIRVRLYLWGKLPVLIRGGYGWDVLHREGGRFYAILGPILYDFMPWNLKRSWTTCTQRFRSTICPPIL